MTKLEIRCKHPKRNLAKQIGNPAYYFCVKCNKMYKLGRKFKTSWRFSDK